MTALIDTPRLNGYALLLSNVDALIHVADRASEHEGHERSRCGYVARQLRRMHGDSAGNRSYLLCPVCMQVLGDD